MTVHFLHRGYPESILKEAVAKATSLSRDLLTPRTPDTASAGDDTEATKVFAITTYHPTDTLKLPGPNISLWNLFGFFATISLSLF